uniref:Uncharacterized protein n=1 Tax=Timema douglasi TaxID=61478 RepID=A0A7R8VPK0_TIMDO|nr:unnamed protein product [Timema douglasi]
MEMDNLATASTRWAACSTRAVICQEFDLDDWSISFSPTKQLVIEYPPGVENHGFARGCNKQFDSEDGAVPIYLSTFVHPIYEVDVIHSDVLIECTAKLPRLVIGKETPVSSHTCMYPPELNKSVSKKRLQQVSE